VTGTLRGHHQLRRQSHPPGQGHRRPVRPVADAPARRGGRPTAGPAALVRPSCVGTPRAVGRSSASVTSWMSDPESHDGTRPDPRARDPHNAGGVPGAAAFQPVRAYRRHRGRDGARAGVAKSAQGIGAMLCGAPSERRD
jgi:hypothetical protein